MSTEPASTSLPVAEPTSAIEDKKLATSEPVPEKQQAPATTTVEDSKPKTDGVTSGTDSAEKPLVDDTKPSTLDKSSEPSAAATETEKKTIQPLSPLSKLFAELPTIVKNADYNEMWGVTLLGEEDVPTSIVLEKFLRANTSDVAKAKAQLTEALRWRKEVQPRKLLEDKEFDSTKFSGLGYVTVYPKTASHEKEIVTWNVYGGVKDKQATFGNVEEFVKWRAALMEISVRELDLASATTPIPAGGVDPYRMLQVHDYLNVSFLRMDPVVKAASKKVIEIFSMAYPELLREKFFVNVPGVMGWVFGVLKLFMSPETVKKFHPMTYGSSLAAELKDFGSELPTAYGGKGKPIEEGLTVKYGAGAVEEPQPATQKAEQAAN